MRERIDKFIEFLERKFFRIKEFVIFQIENKNIYEGTKVS